MTSIEQLSFSWHEPGYVLKIAVDRRSWTLSELYSRQAFKTPTIRQKAFSGGSNGEISPNFAVED
jgi:hypothetical protein